MKTTSSDRTGFSITVLTLKLPEYSVEFILEYLS